MAPNDFIPASMFSFQSCCISSTFFAMFISPLLSVDRIGNSSLGRSLQRLEFAHHRRNELCHRWVNVRRTLHDGVGRLGVHEDAPATAFLRSFTILLSTP